MKRYRVARPLARYPSFDRFIQATTPYQTKVAVGHPCSQPELLNSYIIRYCLNEYQLLYPELCN